MYTRIFIYIYICAVDLRSSYMRSAEGMLGPESRFDQRCRLFFQDYTPYHPLGLEYLPTFEVDVYGFHVRKYTRCPMGILWIPTYLSFGGELYLSGCRNFDRFHDRNIDQGGGVQWPMQQAAPQRMDGSGDPIGCFASKNFWIEITRYAYKMPI